jgi:hypothetical protein
MLSSTGSGQPTGISTGRFRPHTGRYRSGQTGQTVNLLSYDFVGSNPALPTNPSEPNPEFDLRKNAGVAQLVEHQPSKLRVAGSSLVSRSILRIIRVLPWEGRCSSRCSSGVEHFLGKEEVRVQFPTLAPEPAIGMRKKRYLTSETNVTRIGNPIEKTTRHGERKPSNVLNRTSTLVRSVTLTTVRPR